MNTQERRLVVAITGASGSIYGIRFLEAASEYFDRIYLMITGNASEIIRTELGIDLPEDGGVTSSILPRNYHKIELLSTHDLSAAPSSGSVRHEGMVIIPCSMGVAGRIAAGVSDDLVSRAADVCLKERRPLILVARETPLSLIHLRNLTALAEAGATILPASPGFYNKPTSVDDMVSFIVARTMQQLGLAQDLLPEWESPGS